MDGLESLPPVTITYANEVYQRYDGVVTTVSKFILLQDAMTPGLR